MRSVVSETEVLAAGTVTRRRGCGRTGRVRLGNRGPALGRGRVRSPVMFAGGTRRSLPVVVGLLSLGSAGTGSVRVIFLLLEVTPRGLSIPATHADITSYPDSAALVGNSSAEGGALSETGELLRAVHIEGLRLDLHPPVERGIHRRVLRLRSLVVKVLLLLGLLVEVERKLVATLVADGEIGEQEVTGLCGSVEVGHARNRHTSQNRRGGSGGCLNTTVGHGPGEFQSREEEEVGIVVESNILGFIGVGAQLEDAKLDHGRRVNRSAISGRYTVMLVTCSSNLSRS